MVREPAEFRSLAAILTVPPSINTLPPEAVCNSLPVAVPTFRVPDETLIDPLFVIEKPPPPETLLTIAPFTQKPAVFGMLGSEVNWNVPPVILKNPFKRLMFPALETVPVASTTELMSEPLLMIMLLNAEAALPLMVLLPGPVKLILPVPATNVPSLL